MNCLVEIAFDYGASGARLTGAGFGGCVVALAQEDAVDDLIDGIQNRFYSPHGIDGKAAGHMFIARPSQGARTDRI